MESLLKKQRDKYYRTIEWQNIRKIIIDRDNGQCRICGSKKLIRVHHKAGVYKRPGGNWETITSKARQKRITWYKKKMWDSRLLITLCKKCHDELHEKMRVQNIKLPEKYKPKMETKNIIDIEQKIWRAY